MTTTYQVSDKIGDAIFVIKSEADDPGQAFGDFSVALSLIGNQEAEKVLGRLELVLGREGGHPAPLAPATAVVAQSFPQARPATPPVPAAVGGGAPGGAPTCQHGVKEYKTGEKNGRAWQAWACPARSSDATRCGFEWIR